MAEVVTLWHTEVRMSGIFEEANRAKKVLALVAEVERMVAAQKFNEGNVALSLALEGLNPEQWAAIAARASCRTPSAETVAEVVAHFRARLSPLERASMAMAEGGTSGSSGPEEYPHLNDEDRALLREIEERRALGTQDDAKARGCQ